MNLKDTIVLLNRPEKHFLESFYFNKIKYGIDAALEDNDYNLLLAQQDTQLPENLSGKNMQRSGVLNIAPHVNHASLDLLRKAEVPSVLINCRSDEHSWVDVDNVRGAVAITEHLVSLGHERIVFINGFPESQNGMDRLKGFRKTLEKYNIEFNSRMVINGDFSVTLAYERMKNFLSQNKKMEFSAIFASNDYMAVGIIRALTDDNIRVPEDIAVVGFDDFNFSASFYIPLTTYRQPFHNVGYLATKLLLQRLESGKNEIHQAELIGELVIRESCGARHRRQGTVR